MPTDAGFSARLARNVLLRYVLAIAATLTFLLACRELNPLLGDNVAYIILFPVVAFVAWYCGLGPSILTIALVLGGAMYWLIPKQSVHVPNPARSIGALAFLFASTIIVVLAEARRRDNERLRNAQGELEDRVAERTAELDTANQTLRRLSARLLQLQDEERRRIARELHDSVGQMLAALSMNLAGVRADIDLLTKTTAVLTDSEDLVREMSKEVRTISHLLHPPLLDEAGLASALRWYVDGFAQRSKIEVDLDCPNDFGRLPRIVETAAFRLVQECLTNIHRHSGSPTAKIRLRHSDHQVTVEIEDKGKGIPADKLEEMASIGIPGVGITGMRERVRQLGGTLDIGSSGSGTTVRAHLPVSDTPPSEDVTEMPETPSSAAA
jgi:signal transduction histidine kinase